MLTLMNLLRRYPIMSGVLLAIIIACLGSYWGQVFAAHHVSEIAEQVRAKHPDDPLDGLWIIDLGITLTGAIIGTVLGIALGVIFYLWLKSSAISRLRNPAHNWVE